MPSFKYAPLIPSSPDIEDKEIGPSGRGSDEDLLPAITRPQTAGGGKWVIIASWVVICCTVLNIAVAFFVTQSEITSMKSKGPLARPNQFIGLDKLDYNRSRPHIDHLNITTFPTFVHQIDRTQPDIVLPTSARLAFTTFGTISPEMRLFLATEEISTIMQFRARDYGMEHCKMMLSLPSEFERMPGVEEDSYNHPTPAHRPPTWRLSGDTKDLEIWTIDAKEWLSPSKLTYSNRPKRLARLGSWDVRPGETIFTHSFTCPSDSLQSFELFCISQGCKIEVWQDTVKPPVGIALIQHSSL